MSLEIKVKEVNPEDKLPALYSTQNRAKVILVSRIIGNKLEGICLVPKENFGQYSVTWSTQEFSRMGRGSEINIRYTQE